MSEAIETPKAGWRMKVAIFALCVSIFSVIWFALAALGTKWGFWSWEVGLLQMTVGVGKILAPLAVGLALIAQIISLIKAPRKQTFIVALAATLIAAMLMFRLMALGAQAGAVPPIHDIQTDWANPIQYSNKILDARAADGKTNPVVDAPIIDDRAPESFRGKLVSEVQETAEITESGKGTVLKTIEPLYFDQVPADLAAMAETIAKKKGWEIVSPASNGADENGDFLVEATATSGWFGFKDDVAIRIRPVEGATRIDMRSISRVGLSDLGANSTRVYGFMMELQDRADGRTAP